jgi:hypothetical protein
MGDAGVDALEEVHQVLPLDVLGTAFSNNGQRVERA